MFEKQNDDWNGKMWIDQKNAWEKLESIALSDNFIKFFHPGLIQSFMGDIKNGRVETTFYRNGQNLNWWAMEP